MAKKRLTRKKRIIRRIRRIILLILFLALIMAAVYSMPLILKAYELSKEAEKMVKNSTLSTFKETQTTIIYDKDGIELCKMRDSKDLYYVNFSDIPTTLVNAFIVMEDKEYYKHSGIDYKAVVRALIENKRNSAIVQGASTITQQVARNIFLTQDVTWERKIQEMFIARDLEKKYSKEKILEFYLNNIYFGNGYYGVEAAARGYFSKSVDELTMSEQVFIAAIPNNPTRYNPLTNYDNTIRRRNLILKQLYEEDYISSMNYHSASDELINLNPKKIESKNNSVETYVRHCATEGMMRSMGFSFRYNFDSEDDYNQYLDRYEETYTACQQMLLSGGYSIYTSIDMKLQDKLQEAVDNNLSGYTEESEEGVYKMQGAATCIDNTTGNVVAIVGSRSQDLEGYTLNRAYQSYRQSGSAIKPLIVYLPFLQKGNTPETVISDIYDPSGPVNADGAYQGDITVREAVQWSKNTTAWEIYKEITPVVGSTFLLNQGFKKIWMDREYQSICLGGFTYGVSTEEMAGAYACIINQGQYRYATCVEQIFNTSGRSVYDSKNRETTIYDVNSCKMMVDMMKTVVEEGTGRGAIPENAIVAAKTGATNSHKDAWICGFSSYYTLAVWQGYDYPDEIPDIKTIDIFHDFMNEAHKGLKKKELSDYRRPSDDKSEITTEEETETEETTQETSEGAIEETLPVEGSNMDSDIDAETKDDEDAVIDDTQQETTAGTDNNPWEWDAGTL